MKAENQIFEQLLHSKLILSLKMEFPKCSEPSQHNLRPRTLGTLNCSAFSENSTSSKKLCRLMWLLFMPGFIIIDRGSSKGVGGLQILGAVHFLPERVRRYGEHSKNFLLFFQENCWKETD